MKRRERGDEPATAQKRRRRRRWVYVIVAALLFAVGVAGTGAYLYRDLDEQIRTDDVFDQIVAPRPQQRFDAAGNTPLNILVLGTDTRSGDAGRSDTNILLHIAGDKSRAQAVSIPRDLIVDRPACRSRTDPDRMVPEAEQRMWNEAYSVGGTACTVAQFEKMSGIFVNHFIRVEFDSVKDVADALDGVPICMPYTVDDPANGIYLPEGSYDAKGEVAVSYVRARYNIGDGGDLGRLKRQQAFLAAMLSKASSVGTMANPLRFYNFLDAATENLETDPLLGKLENLIGLQNDLDDIGLDNVNFLTMPVAPYAPDPNRLAVGPGASQLWREINDDQPLSPRFLEEGTSAAEGEASTGKERNDENTPQEDGADSAPPATAPSRALSVARLSGWLVTAPGEAVAARDDVDPERYGLCD